MSKLTTLKKPARKKGANGYKLPDPIPVGEILIDITKRKWRIGQSIGVGGFGEIYSASEVTETHQKNTVNPFVIKIEPHENGPLFVEMHFYKRVGKEEEINEWIKEKKLSGLGMPRHISSGSHQCNGMKYRFVVMDHFSKDLWSIFLENKRKFPVQTILRIGYQIINTLEYIHSKSYVHADIKGANLLLGKKKGHENQVYLVDFGMASKYVKGSKPDPKKAHNGTPEYTSRDAHNGVMSMRGDMEILGYNMLQWLCSTLPWEGDIGNVLKLQQQKVAFMANIPSLMKKCFVKSTPPAFIVKYFEYLSNMSIDDVPDYDYCRTTIKNSIKTIGFTLEGKLDFTIVNSPAPQKVPRGKAKAAIETDDDDIVEATPPKKSRQTKAQTNGSVKKSVAQSHKALLCDLGDESDSVEEVSLQKPKKRPTKSAAKQVPVNTVKPTWKDCPTAVASNITRPGEYKSRNTTTAKPTKRK